MNDASSTTMAVPILCSSCCWLFYGWFQDIKVLCSTIHYFRLKKKHLITNTYSKVTVGGWCWGLFFWVAHYCGECVAAFLHFFG